MTRSPHRSASQHLVQCRRAEGRLGYLGIGERHVGTKRFRGRVRYQGRIILGPYRATALEAARDRDELAKKFYGKYACLNFERGGST